MRREDIGRMLATEVLNAGGAVYVPNAAFSFAVA